MPDTIHAVPSSDSRPSEDQALTQTEDVTNKKIALDTNIQSIASDVTIPVSGVPELTIVNAIDVTAFDLNAAAFSQASSITDDYILNNIKLNFSTTESKTITVTGPDGTVIYKDTNTSQNVSIVDINMAINASENFTVAVTIFSSAGTMDCIAVIEKGSASLGGQATKFLELTQSGLDANNSATVSNALDLEEKTFVGFQINDGSGAHTTHKFKAQCSFDNITFHDISGAVTAAGLGVLDGISTASRYFRIAVDTVEGGASTVDIIIQAK